MIVVTRWFLCGVTGGHHVGAHDVRTYKYTIEQVASNSMDKGLMNELIHSRILAGCFTGRGAATVACIFLVLRGCNVGAFVKMCKTIKQIHLL